MISSISIKWQTPFAPGIARKAMREIIKATWHDVGVLWHSQMRPKHFTKRGAREYGYATRQGERATPGSRAFRRSYTGRKFREKGHTLPLVWTGESRALSRLRDVRATSTRVRIVMRTNRLNLRHRSSRINMAQELRTISRSEQRAIRGFINRTVDKRIRDAEREKRTTRVQRFAAA